MSERTPTTSTPSAGETSDLETPRLRLAGTNAGPVTDEERRLLSLRVLVIRARGLHAADAEIVRERLGRAGRQDPMELIRGQDVFARSAEDLDAVLSVIDARLAELDARRPRVEVDPGAEDLLRRH